MKRIELLAPAGNFDCLKAAISNGANAVYLGGSLFSARAFANNFDEEEMKKAVEYAHLRNVKVYVTINTLMNELEIDKAFKAARYYHDINVDALLVQDLGLFYRIRKELPDFELHASTQMHIHNLPGIRNAKSLGFSRVVIPRESSLDFIREAGKEGIEIETFIHGAICVSYSGQCLMSSLTKNRSANKGMCAQCCRLRYELYEGDRKIDTDTDYLLSPKDMFLLENIPDLIEAGVSSLKIEGRMKSPAYVAYVTRVYREAIDAFYNAKPYILDKETLNNLKSLFNRGFTNTYLLNDNKELFGNARPNHMGVEIGEVIKTVKGLAYIRLTKQLNQFDGIRIVDGNSDGEGLILNKLTVGGKLVGKAFKDEIVEIPLTYAKKGNKVYRTKDNTLENEILTCPEKKVPISYDISIGPKEKLKLKIKGNDFHYERESDFMAEEAIRTPISEKNIADVFSKVGEHPYTVENVSISLKPCFVSLKVLNEFRRETLDLLDSYRLNLFQRRENPLEIGDFKVNQVQDELIWHAEEPKLNSYCFNEAINPKGEYGTGDNFVSEFGGLLLKGNKIGSYTLNITNSYAYEFLLRLGFTNSVLSLELDKDNVHRLIEGFYRRNHVDIHPYIFVYGRRELMHLARNPFSRYVKNLDDVWLNDGQNRYLVIQRKYSVDLIEYKPYLSDLSDYPDCLAFSKINYPEENR